MMKIADIPNIRYTESDNFFLIAGPCVVENEEICYLIAEKVISLCDKYKIPYIFKASYRKANRSKHNSFSGLGDKKALEILKMIKENLKIPVITDIHSAVEAEFAAQYVDILQIPAFLCRQTDILEAASKTGKHVNIKKGQFIAPGSMRFVIDKVIEFGNNKVMITDRGTMFGYQDLIVDYRGIYEMRAFGYPVILDITHSLQQPNQLSGVSGGRPELIETIAMAAIAVKTDGIFLETHPDPQNAKSDGSNMLKLDNLDNLLKKLVALKKTVNSFD